MDRNETHPEPLAQKYHDRITVFNHLTVDEIEQSQNQEKFDKLLTDAYPMFVKFCDDVIKGNDSSKIIDVSCYIKDGNIVFETRTASVESIDISADTT